MVASGPDVRGDRRLASGWLAHRDALGGARAAQLGRQGIRHRRRADGVHAGLTARVRRRPHRRHRQHHPQADERRTPTPCRRVLLFTGPLHGGLRAGGNAGDRTQGYRRTGRERLLDAASLHRLDRYQHFRRVPVFDRHPQRHRPGRIVRVFAHLRRGDYDEAELEQQLDNRGLLIRFLGRFTKSLTKSWHMYPVGFLFGLGFDTATEIALLVLAGTSAAAGLPGMPSCACPSCSPPACVCWTPSTVRS